MEVKDILKKFPILILKKGKETTHINYIQSDSRKLEKDDIYCLYDEHVSQANGYIKKALELHCKCLFLSSHAYESLESKINLVEFDLIILSKENISNLHGKIASFLLGDPSNKLNMIAVTGTNGKTTITSVLYELFCKLNLKAGLIGTIQIKFGSKSYETGYTTPDPSILQKVLQEMVTENIEYVFIEASSHGLKLGRLNGCNLKAALFSNLTPDHLDFHPNMDDYLKSKFILFKLLEESIHKERVSILSIDSPGSKDMHDLIETLNPSFKVFTFGSIGTYMGSNLKLSLEKTTFNITKNNNSVQISTNLLGNYNYLNIGLVFSICCEILSYPMEKIADTLSSIHPVNGRFELVYPQTKDRVGIVDYAHTPDALENILLSIREIPNEKIITVFGCGGDRDTKKRPVMGEIACKYSDYAIITSDNPRTENPNSILQDIEKGIVGVYNNYILEVDRRAAIKMGVKMLPKNGFLLIAGKGHENYQIIGTKKFTFSDREELENAFLGEMK
jgi:UDP-N-acetylmuramoyl-L-alanyl-D-glutamate--2,6-diaminopimelate ligase